MHPRLTRAAILATLIVPQLAGNPTAAQSGPPPRPTLAYALVVRLVEHREKLALDSNQIAELTDLAHRLRTGPGRLKTTGRGVPGKAGRRVEREPVSSREALRNAFRVLSPEQRLTAARLIESDTTNLLHR